MSNLPKGRYIVLVWIIPFFFVPGYDWFFRLFLDDYDSYWWDVLYYYYFYSLALGVIISLIYTSKINWKNMLGSFDRNDLKPSFKLTIFILLFSVATTYLLYYPLSFVIPDFVTWWYLEMSPLIYKVNDSYPFLPNLLNLITLVILAPLIEEFMFRGLLLHRWTEKWGLYRAIIFSSLIFAIMHADIIGAFAFGIAMSFIYLKTNTLWIPILCHALNNLICWLLEAGYRFAGLWEEEYTLDEFRNEWYIGAICGVLVFIWFITYMKQPYKKVGWALPNI